MYHLNKLIHNKKLLTQGERKIVDYILQNPAKLKQLSSQELATILGISQSSIIKCSQKLKFKGFTHLKMSLIEELSQFAAEKKHTTYFNEGFSTDDDLPTVATKLLFKKQEVLRQTLENINFNQLTKIITKLTHAKLIQVIGVGDSFPVSKDFAYKIIQIGFPVLSELDRHAQIIFAQSLRKNDVQIVISFSGRNKELNIAAETAKKNGATIIAITSLELNPLQQLAHYTLNTVSDTESSNDSSISICTSQMAITDLLFFCLLQKNIDHSYQLIQQCKTLVEKTNH